jgi:hypothetical protein
MRSSVVTGSGFMHMQLAASATYIRSGTGEDLVLKHSADELLAGKFMLPGETHWYDSWPWKLLWPALVSIVTTLVIQAHWAATGWWTTR